MTQRSRHLWLLALAALAVRAPLFLISTGAPFDMESYARVAQASASALYSSAETAGRYPYLPLWWLVLKALKGLQSVFGGDFSIWARLPGLLGDLAICLLAYLLMERRSRSNAALAAGPDALLSARSGLLAGLAWALNPLAVMTSVMHGQFGSLPLALLMAGAWYLEYSPSPRAELWAGLCLAAAIAFKTWPLAYLPLFMGAFASRRGSWRFAAWALLPPVLLLLPFIALNGLEPVLGRLNYFGATALGFSGALRASFFAVGAPVEAYRIVDDAWRLLSLGALGLAWLWLFWQGRRLRLLDGMAWVALSLVIAAPGLAPEYLIWPAAMLLLQSVPLVWRYTLACIPLKLGFYALFIPQALLGDRAWAPPVLAPWMTLAWAALNLAWLGWASQLWLRLQRQNLTPRRGTLFR